MNSHHFRPSEARVLSLPSRRGRANGERPPSAAAVGTELTDVTTAGRGSPDARPATCTTEDGSSPGGDVSLEEAWQKVFRVRELFDVELATLREQQALLQLRLVKVERQEAAWSALNKLITEREAQLSAREHATLSAARNRQAGFSGRFMRLVGLQPA